MEHEISVKRELLNEDLDIAEESDTDRLEIAADPHPDSSKDVIESLLLLGKQAVVGKASDPPISLLRPRSFSIIPASEAFTAFSNSRRHSSSGSSEPGAVANDKGAVLGVSYYQVTFF